MPSQPLIRVDDVPERRFPFWPYKSDPVPKHIREQMPVETYRIVNKKTDWAKGKICLRYVLPVKMSVYHEHPLRWGWRYALCDHCGRSVHGYGWRCSRLGEVNQNIKGGIGSIGLTTEECHFVDLCSDCIMHPFKDAEKLIKEVKSADKSTDRERLLGSLFEKTFRRRSGSMTVVPSRSVLAKLLKVSTRVLKRFEEAEVVSKKLDLNLVVLAMITFLRTGKLGEKDLQRKEPPRSPSVTPGPGTWEHLRPLDNMTTYAAMTLVQRSTNWSEIYNKPKSTRKRTKKRMRSKKHGSGARKAKILRCARVSKKSLSKKSSKSTKQKGNLLLEFIRKIPSRKKNQKPRVEKDSIDELQKMPRLPTKARKQTVTTAKRVGITKTEWEQKLRISSELLEKHLKLGDVSHLQTSETINNKQTKELSGTISKTVENPSTSKIEVCEPTSGQVNPYSRQLGIKPLELSKIVSTEGPSTEESVGSFAPLKHTKTNSAAKNSQRPIELGRVKVKLDQLPKEETTKEDNIFLKADQPSEPPKLKVISDSKRVLNSIKHIHKKRKLADHSNGQSRKELPNFEADLNSKTSPRGRPRKQRRTQSKNSSSKSKGKVLTSSTSHVQSPKKSLFGARNHQGAKVAVPERLDLKDKVNGTQAPSPEVSDTGQWGDVPCRFLGPIYPVYSVFDSEETPNSQRIKSRILVVTSYFGNTLVSLRR